MQISSKQYSSVLAAPCSFLSLYHIALVTIGVEELAVQVGGGDHVAEGLAGVPIAEALEVGVDDDRDRVVADHAVGFLAAVGPDRKVAVVRAREPVVCQAGLDEVIDAAGLDECQKRVLGAERIPERQFGVVVEPLDGVHLAVGASDLAVNVTQERGGDQGMVDGRVKSLLEVLILGLDLKRRRGRGPRRCGGGGDGLEIPAGQLSLEVLAGTIDAHRRRAPRWPGSSRRPGS